MRRWFADRFMLDAREWTPRGRAPAGGGGLGGPAAMAALLALIVVLLFAPIWHRIALSWTQPAGQVKLAAVWTKALTDLDLKPGRALLTSFEGSWSADGSLAGLQFTAETSDRLQMVVYAERPAGSSSLSVVAGKNGNADTLWAAYQGLHPDALPGVDQVLDSLDAAGLFNVAKALNATVEQNEVLELQLEGTSAQSPPGGYPVLAVTEGKISPAASADGLASQPAMLFRLSRAEPAGATRSFIGSVLVR